MANRSLFQSIRGALLPPTTATNAAAAPAYALGPQAALAQLAATGCLTNTYYASAETQLDRVLELAAGLEADLVILDLNMPGLGGAGTLPLLRALRPALPVLLATGRLDDATVSALRKDGKALGIFKPFSMAELDLKFKVLETLRHAGAAGH